MTNDNEAHALSPRDIVLRSDDEPRIADLALAVRLGFERPRKIRDLILRNLEELETYGELPVFEGSPHGGANPKGGRPGKTYYLNEGQALVLCALARTPVAATIRREIITVFQAYRRSSKPNGDQYREMMLVRGLLDRGIDTLLELVNAIDVNFELEDDTEDNDESDKEPTLGGWGGGTGYGTDECEADGDDKEPSLGATEDMDHTVAFLAPSGWSVFDGEEECEDEENGDERDANGDEHDHMSSEDDHYSVLNPSRPLTTDAQIAEGHRVVERLRVLTIRLKGRGEGSILKD